MRGEIIAKGCHSSIRPRSLIPIISQTTMVSPFRIDTRFSRIEPVVGASTIRATMSPTPGSSGTRNRMSRQGDPPPSANVKGSPTFSRGGLKTMSLRVIYNSMNRYTAYNRDGNSLLERASRVFSIMGCVEDWGYEGGSYSLPSLVGKVLFS